MHIFLLKFKSTPIYFKIELIIIGAKDECQYARIISKQLHASN